MVEQINNGICKFHTGFDERIKHCETSIDCLGQRFDKMLTRLNVALGGVAVSCLLLVINLLVQR